MDKITSTSTSITITTRMMNQPNRVLKVIIKCLILLSSRYVILYTFRNVKKLFWTIDSQSTSISPQSSQQTNSKSNKDIKENNKPKKSGTIQDENQFVQTTSKGRLVIFYLVTYLHNNVCRMSHQIYLNR